MPKHREVQNHSWIVASLCWNRHASHGGQQWRPSVVQDADRLLYSLLTCTHKLDRVRGRPSVDEDADERHEDPVSNKKRSDMRLDLREDRSEGPRSAGGRRNAPDAGTARTEVGGFIRRRADRQSLLVVTIPGGASL